MLLTILAAGAATCLGMKIHDKYEETCTDKQLELWRIESDCDEIVEESKRLIKVTKTLYTKQFNALEKVRDDVYDTTFKKFKDVAGKIVNVEFNSDLAESNKFASNLESITVQMPEIDVPSIEYEWDGAHIFAMAVLSPVGMALAKLGELDKAVNKAELELSQLEYEYEQIKTECAKVKSIYLLTATLRLTILNFQCLADNAIKSLEEITTQSGYDFTKYTQEEKEHVFLTFKFVEAVNKLVNMQVINKNGNINRKLKHFIEVTSSEVKRLTAESTL